MDRMFDLGAWMEVVAGSFRELGASVGGFVPRLVEALAVLVVGWIVARALELVLTRAVRLVGIDRAATRRRLVSRLERAGITAAPSAILGGVAFWLVLLAFAVPAARTLALPAVNDTLERLFGLLPSILAAGLVTVLGLILARFVGGVVRSAAGAADLPLAARLGSAAEAVVALLVIFIALQQLGVDPQLVIVAATVLVTAMALTVGLTFALAARPIVTHILAGHFLRRSLPPETTVEIAGRRGVVERVGATDTLLRDGEKTWSVPNGRMLEEIVDR
jgi:hypothetical protein